LPSWLAIVAGGRGGLNLSSSVYGAIAGAGGALGLLLGGILTSYASWRWTLFVNLVFAATATVGALLWLKRR
jgi:MFS family permease